MTTSALAPPTAQGSARAATWNDLRWRTAAACRDIATDFFFPVGQTGPAIDQVRAAKALCIGCESRLSCLEFALATNQEYGVWGGYDEDERRMIRRQRRAASRRAALEAKRSA
jgi:WhiB family transcriptional regulator, redox-sensing transcriptional regulator